MKIFNHSSQVMTINGDQVDVTELYVPMDFDGTVSIGSTVLTLPDYCETALIIDDGAGIEIWYEETPVPHIFWAATFMVILGGTAFILRLVQKLKTA